MDRNKYITLIKEGLIKTWNILKYESNLNIELNSIGLEFDINIINKFSYEISIYNIEWFKKQTVLDQFFQININLLGYFPTSFFMILKNGMSKTFKYDEKDFYDNINLKNISKIKILFNSKYEDGEFKNDLNVPNFLYHISSVKNRNKILNYGLYPKSGKRKNYHPERIYFLYYFKDHEKLIDNFKLTDIINKKPYTSYDLYKINCKNLDIIIHTDPNFFNKGCYTYDNINPNRIEIIKKDI